MEHDPTYDARLGKRPVGQLTFLPGDPGADGYVRVLRVVEYIGPRAWVEDTVARAIHGTRVIVTREGKAAIRAGTIGSYPEVLGGVIGIHEAAVPQTLREQILALQVGDLFQANGHTYRVVHPPDLKAGTVCGTYPDKDVYTTDTHQLVTFDVLIEGITGVGRPPDAPPAPAPDPAPVPAPIPTIAPASLKEMQERFGAAYTEDPTVGVIVHGETYHPGDAAFFFEVPVKVRGVIPPDWVILASWRPPDTPEAFQPMLDVRVYARTELTKQAPNPPTADPAPATE